MAGKHSGYSSSKEQISVNLSANYPFDHFHLKVADFLKLYQEDSLIQTFAGQIRQNTPHRVQLKGLVGSLDAVIAATIYQIHSPNCLFVLQDKDEATYFQNDLQNLLGDQEVLLFPASYKKPYQFEETENANVLMRAEVLSNLNQKEGAPAMIVTYPDALHEKVINKRSLRENTFSAKVGEKVDSNFLADLLITYDFEKTEFVYEAGQFSVRGGIVDIFSYANELPYRIELFGDEIESIRTFNPLNQLSVESVQHFSIVPNVQARLNYETRQAFLDFLPAESLLWFKDVELTLDIVQKYYEKAEESFERMLVQSGQTQVITHPEALYETHKSFLDQIKKFTTVEFGKRFHFRTEEKLMYQSRPQPSFNKDFNRLLENLQDNQTHGITNIIVADSPKQIERLNTIFDELNPLVKFLPLGISFREGFIDEQLKIACYTDHQIFDRFHQYKIRQKFAKSKALTLKELRTLQPGDYVTHIDYGIGRFAGLEKVEVNGREQEAIRLVYRDDDLLYVSIHSLHKISKYSGKEGGPPQMSKLGSQDWENKKSRAKKQVKDIAKELISLYAKRRAAPGFAFSEDGFMQAELESSFIYEDTPDQAKATTDVKADMEQAHPMDRLVCGDVGFGKTEVAIRAAFKAVTDSKQVAILVPTTILAMQHYKTFKERLEKFPCTVEYINRFKTPQQIKETLQKVEKGEIDILIGTHRIVSKDVKFKNLGLMVVDEEQKFGVKTKEKLKEMRVNVDALTLTATPIPRTLHFSLMGARDLSVIATPPPNRQPVTTEMHIFDEVVIRDAVSAELRRGGQVFFVHNRIEDITEIGNTILRLVPDARIGIAHGQMEGPKLEKVMMKFIEGEADVLVSTNIIESGLDIPNANTIIINRAHMFGLSDLHQMRGRVGRSNKKAYCYLLTPPTATLSSDARKRLSTLEEFTDLGDGFKVAMRDLDIRGAGNLLGSEQSGFISELGFEMYHKILDEAVQELKENEFKELFQKEMATKVIVPDCIIETDLQILIPDQYISNVSERLSLYSKLDNIKDKESLDRFKSGLIDRFGPLPEEVTELIETVVLRWKAEEIGFEKLTLKNDTLKGYFVSGENEAYFKSEKFGKILTYLQKHPKNGALKEVKNKLLLTFSNIRSIRRAIETLEHLIV